MKHKVIALTAALSMLGGSIAALPAMAAGNIVDNGAFEADTASWESTGSNALSWEDTYANKNGVANIAANASNAIGAAHGIKQDLLSKGIEPASTYTFEADIYTLEHTNETATFNIYFLTSWTPNDYQPTASNIVAGGGMQLKPNQWNHVEYTLETPAEDSDLWKKVEGEYSYSSSETEIVIPPAELNLTIESNWGTNAAFYIDNITLTKVGDEPGGDPGDTYVAEVNGKKYTSLDAAITEANGATITLLDDATLSENRKDATAVIEGGNHTITVNLPNGEAYSSIFSNLTLSNATLTGSTNQNIAINANLTNVTVAELSYDCLAISNLTATNCNLEHNGGVYVFAGNDADGKLSMTDTTITVIQLGWTNLLFRVPANDTPTFSNVTIKGLTATGTKIAEVNETEGPGSGSVSKEGITVEGLADTQELKVVDGKQLVIADKPAPASYTAEVGDAEVQHGTGDYANTVATGFQATVTNNGGTEGTFNTVKWDVTSNSTTKTTGEQTMKTTVTLKTNAQATISLIVNGLNDANAKAEVQIIK